MPCKRSYLRTEEAYGFGITYAPKLSKSCLLRFSFRAMRLGSTLRYGVAARWDRFGRPVVANHQLNLTHPRVFYLRCRSCQISSTPTRDCPNLTLQSSPGCGKSTELSCDGSKPFPGAARQPTNPSNPWSTLLWRNREFTIRWDHWPCYTRGVTMWWGRESSVTSGNWRSYRS